MAEDLTNDSTNLQQYTGHGGKQIGQVMGNVIFSDSTTSAKDNIGHVIADLVDRSNQFGLMERSLQEMFKANELKPVVATTYGPESHDFDSFSNRWQNAFLGNLDQVLSSDEALSVKSNSLNILPTVEVRLEYDYTINTIREEHELDKKASYKPLAIHPYIFCIRKGHWSQYKTLFRHWLDFWCYSYQNQEGYIPFILNIIETDRRILKLFNAGNRCEQEITQLLNLYIKPDIVNNACILKMNDLTKINQQDLDNWVNHHVKKDLKDYEIDIPKLKKINKKFFQGNIKEVTYAQIRDQLVDNIKGCILRLYKS